MTAVSHSSFAIVGAGGLGGPIAYGLAAAGAKRLRVWDHDRVELSNLQRQVQFTSDDIGRGKVDALTDELARRGYPRDRVHAVAERFDADTSAPALAEDTTVVIDASDDPDTKFYVAGACMHANKPYVIASALRYGGQVMVGSPGHGGCYRCFFEEPPAAEESLSCSEAGVLGAAVAVIAGHAVRAAIELASAPTLSRLLVVEDVRRSATPRAVVFNQRPDCSCNRTSTNDPAACAPPRQEVG